MPINFPLDIWICVADTHRSGNGDTSRFLFRRLVDLRVVHKLAAALLRHEFGDGSGQGRLAVVDMLLISFYLPSSTYVAHADGTDATNISIKPRGLGEISLEVRLASAEFAAGLGRISTSKHERTGSERRSRGPKSCRGSFGGESPRGVQGRWTGKRPQRC